MLLAVIYCCAPSGFSDSNRRLTATVWKSKKIEFDEGKVVDAFVRKGNVVLANKLVLCRKSDSNPMDTIYFMRKRDDEQYFTCIKAIPADEKYFKIKCKRSKTTDPEKKFWSLNISDITARGGNYSISWFA